MPRLRPAHVHLGFVLVTAALCAAFAAFPGPVGTSAVVASSLLPALLLLGMLLRGRITAPMPWWFVVAGLAVLTVHNLDSLVQVGLGGRPAATGAIALATLPLGYVGLLVAAFLVTFRYARHDIGGIADAVLIGLSAASLVWVGAISPALAEQDAGLGKRVYVLVVVLLVAGIAGAVIRATSTSRAARPALAYLLVAVVTTLVGNVAKVLTTDPVTQAPARWIGMVWIVGYVALAAAAVHPAHVHLSAPERQVSGRLGSGRVLFLGAALALYPVLVGLEALFGQSLDILLLVVGSLLVVPLVMLRVAQLARLHAAAEAELARLATHDVLTDLPNRRAIDQHIEGALLRVSAGTSAGVVVLFCDLDDFKKVNDAHGHHLGDRLLVAVARRLRGVVRVTDLVGRFGGDEFVVVIEGDPDVVLDETLARIEDTLRAPVHLDDVVASAAASIGSAVVRPGDDVSAEQVLSAADARMYEHKRALRAAR